MNLAEVQAAIEKLSVSDLRAFAKWFEEFLADAWDQQIEADIKAGRLDAIAEMRAPQIMQDRVADLIHKEKTLGLSTEEADLLDQLMRVEHVMRLAKARARLPGLQ